MLDSWGFSGMVDPSGKRRPVKPNDLASRADQEYLADHVTV